MDYKSLRQKYREFVYKSFSFKVDGKDLLLSFIYKIPPDLNFEHKIVLKNIDLDEFNKLNIKILNNLVFNVGLVEIPSYWKTTCSPIINVEAGSLDSWQIDWWKKLFMNGMMQYFYTNQIDFREDGFFKIYSSGGKVNSTKANVNSRKILVPIGGGKDSVVSMEILRKNFEIGLFMVKPTTPASWKMIKRSGLESSVVERIFDPQLFELNKSGYLNGHNPVTSVMFMLSLLSAYIFDYKYIAFSNERSSGEGNLYYLEKEVNHQFSKTFEFENGFRNYNQKYLSNIELFSFLRPLYQIQITKLFSKFESYFPIIRSCNVGQKEGVWCGECSKCLSTYILLYPFMGQKTNDIFGKELFVNKKLERLLGRLIDDRKEKPFQCLGTRIETKIALNMATKKYSNNNLPYLLKKFKDTKFYDNDFLNGREKELMKSFGENNIPAQFRKLLKSNI